MPKQEKFPLSDRGHDAGYGAGQSSKKKEGDNSKKSREILPDKQKG